MNVGCECLVKVWGSGERLVRGDLVTGTRGAGAGRGYQALGVLCLPEQGYKQSDWVHALEAGVMGVNDT